MHQIRITPGDRTKTLLGIPTPVLIEPARGRRGESVIWVLRARGILGAAHTITALASAWRTETPVEIRMAAIQKAIELLNTEGDTLDAHTERTIGGGMLRSLLERAGGYAFEKRLMGAAQESKSIYSFLQWRAAMRRLGEYILALTEPKIREMEGRVVPGEALAREIIRGYNGDAERQAEALAMVSILGEKELLRGVRQALRGMGLDELGPAEKFLRELWI